MVCWGQAMVEMHTMDTETDVVGQEQPGTLVRLNDPTGSGAVQATTGFIWQLSKQERATSHLLFHHSSWFSIH